MRDARRQLSGPPSRRSTFALIMRISWQRQVSQRPPRASGTLDAGVRLTLFRCLKGLVESLVDLSSRFICCDSLLHKRSGASTWHPQLSTAHAARRRGSGHGQAAAQLQMQLSQVSPKPSSYSRFLEYLVIFIDPRGRSTSSATRPRADSRLQLQGLFKNT